MTINKILWPLRRLHGVLDEIQQRHRFRQYMRGVKICIIGTPTHKNVGDSAIAIAQHLFLQKCGFCEREIKEITLREYNLYSKYLRRWIPKDVLITHIGGGNLGNQWMQEEELHRRITIEFADNPMIIFPQTIYWTNDELGKSEEQNSVFIYNKTGNFVMFAREQRSYNIMKELYPNTQIGIAPDIVLSTHMEDYGVKVHLRKGALLCLRSDIERALPIRTIEILQEILASRNYSVRVTDMYSDVDISKFNRKEVVRQKMEEFSGAEIVITDRLHGMVFATITGTPCIVLSNYNHKVSGTYEWIRDLPYICFAESLVDVEKYLDELSSVNFSKFDPSLLLPHFTNLAQMVKSYGNISDT